MQSQNTGQQTSSNESQYPRRKKYLNCNTLKARKQLCDFFQMVMYFVMTHEGSEGMTSSLKSLPIPGMIMLFRVFM